MKDVYVLQHVRAENKDSDEDVKFIGVYSSLEAAKLSVARLSERPGFCDYPDGWHIDRYEMDTDSWAEGFVTSL